MFLLACILGGICGIAVGYAFVLHGDYRRNQQRIARDTQDWRDLGNDRDAITQEDGAKMDRPYWLDGDGSEL